LYAHTAIVRGDSDDESLYAHTAIIMNDSDDANNSLINKICAYY
jgi:hypothetical protein